MKKNGFTLVELLVVFAILAFLALIMIPIISNIIDETEKDAFKTSADNMIEVIRLDNTKKDFDAEKYEIIDGKVTDSQEKKVHVEENNNINGFVEINIDGDISLQIANGDWCVYKDFNDKQTKIEEFDGSRCE